MHAWQRPFNASAPGSPRLLAVTPHPGSTRMLIKLIGLTLVSSKPYDEGVGVIYPQFGWRALDKLEIKYLLL